MIDVGLISIGLKIKFKHKGIYVVKIFDRSYIIITKRKLNNGNVDYLIIDVIKNMVGVDCWVAPRYNYKNDLEQVIIDLNNHKTTISNRKSFPLDNYEIIK